MYYISPNGAGKTTLLKLLINLYRADGGAVSVCGELAGSATKRFISYMPDLNPLFEWMLVHEAIGYYNDLFTDFDRERAVELCTFLNIDEAAKVSKLSLLPKAMVKFFLPLIQSIMECSPFATISARLGL